MNTLKSLTLAEFRASPRRDALLHKDGLAPLIAPAPAANSNAPIGWCFSDTSVDRALDRVLGWDLVQFRRNPVCLWAHRSDASPIGRVLNITFSNGRLTGAIEFVDASMSRFADQIRRMVLGGWLRTASVGFKPLRWAPSTDPRRPGGIDFTMVELLECSLCPVPANPAALVMDGKAMTSGPVTVGDRIARARQLAAAVAPALRPTNKAERIAHAARVVKALSARPRPYRGF